MARASNYENSFYDLSNSLGDLSDSENDISFVCSGRPSTTSSGRRSTASSGRPSTSTNGRSEMSFVSSGRPSTSTTGSPSFVYEFPESGLTPRMSTGSGQSVGSMRLGIRFNDTNIQHDFSFVSQDSGRSSCSCSPQNLVGKTSLIGYSYRQQCMVSRVFTVYMFHEMYRKKWKLR